MTPGTAVFISDIHVGSDTFLEDAWDRFSGWLDESDVSYLLFAGDLVDGIGCLPGPGAELTIENIYEQYEFFAECSSDLPSRLTVILAPGNHDVVRGAEPQPAIPTEFTGKFPKNCMFVENPALVSLQGVRFYVPREVNRRSYRPYTGCVVREPSPMTEWMLQRRHLAPTYGRRTPIAPVGRTISLSTLFRRFCMTGHVHVMGIVRGPWDGCVNAGTWQSQTSFQKQMNIHPTPVIR